MSVLNKWRAVAGALVLLAPAAHGADSAAETGQGSGGRVISWA